MQVGTEFVILSGILTIIVTMTMSIFLGWKWLKQDARLMTDLPLVFAIAGICNTLNALFLTLPAIGILEPSLELFRLRSIAIGGAIVPVTGALLQIWASSKQKYHNKLVLALAGYWFAVAILGTSEALIMSLTIPPLLMISLAMMATFIITWKTGRLKEVRSDLLVFSSLFMIVSQLMRVPLLSTPLFYIPDIALMGSMIFLALGIANPWASRDVKKKNDESPEMAQYA
ncbi:hypothetical protein EU528_10805 [Candidatus Thorarchaeota archaeon]|nr:MAG: hypothetical protein EU528_10805 [Candidatus Thorarchaeota archaeon]